MEKGDGRTSLEQSFKSYLGHALQANTHQLRGSMAVKYGFKA